MWSIYINPQTGDYEVVEGRLARCTRALGKVLSATTTRKGSVPGLPAWGSDMSQVTHLDSTTPERLRAEHERVLRDMVGSDLRAYSVAAFESPPGVLQSEIQITGLDGEVSSDVVLVTG